MDIITLLLQNSMAWKLTLKTRRKGAHRRKTHQTCESITPHYWLCFKGNQTMALFLPRKAQFVSSYGSCTPKSHTNTVRAIWHLSLHEPIQTQSLTVTFSLSTSICVLFLTICHRPHAQSCCHINFPCSMLLVQAPTIIMGHQGDYTKPDILGSAITLKALIFLFIKLFHTNYFFVLPLQIYHQRIAKILSLTAVLGLVQRWTHKRFNFSLV